MIQLRLNLIYFRVTELPELIPFFLSFNKMATVTERGKKENKNLANLQQMRSVSLREHRAACAEFRDAYERDEASVKSAWLTLDISNKQLMGFKNEFLISGSEFLCEEELEEFAEELRPQIQEFSSCQVAYQDHVANRETKEPKGEVEDSKKEVYVP